MKLSNKLVLASGSPRRKQLLQDAGFDFEIKTVPVEEIFPDDLEAHIVAEYLAVLKNKANRKALTDEIVLTADTVVILNDQILGKPLTHQEAMDTIHLLSGEIHEVVTGVCMSDTDRSIAFSCTTQVKFTNLSEDQVKHYVSTFQPMDKAGSYAIQEWIGLIGVEWIRGSFYNVVGLPIDRVYAELLKNF